LTFGNPSWATWGDPADLLDDRARCTLAYAAGWDGAEFMRLLM
jgi:hypothetical protein